MLKKFIAIFVVFIFFLQSIGLDSWRIWDKGVQVASTVANAAEQAVPPTKVSGNEVIWVDDSLPGGAQGNMENDEWNWVSESPAPYSGSKLHKSKFIQGRHQHYFDCSAVPMNVTAGSWLFCWVYLESGTMPREIMLQWHVSDGTSWDHRAYWGENLIVDWGADGTESRKYMGALPQAGQWVMLSVPASAVGLEGKSVTGMSFSLYDGSAAWDAAGLYQPEKNLTWVDDALPVGAQGTGANDEWCWVSESPAPYSGTKSHKSKFIQGNHQHYFENSAVPMNVTVGSSLFCWVYLESGTMPREIMLQWFVGDGTSWNHRAYWGENLIDWGTDGTESRKNMGALPQSGQWVMLSVPASAVGLEGKSVTGMSFTLYDGSVAWDAAGFYQPEGEGPGLKGEYYGDTSLSCLKLTRSGENVNFKWGNDSPDSSVPADNFSVRWTGQIEPKYTEAYTFYTATDDGVKLLVNGQLLIDHWAPQGGTEWSGKINLEAGKKYDIEMRYYEQGGEAGAYLKWSSQSQVKEVIPKSQLYLPQNLIGNGTGLKGDYFSDQNLTDLKLSKTDSKIDFNWGSGSPDTSIGADNFSVRWTGQVQPKYTQLYTFYTATDDGVRLWVDEHLLIDQWSAQSGDECHGTILLEAGKKYDIRMDYFEQGGSAGAYLRWSSPSQVKEIIPQSQLYLPQVQIGSGTGLKGEYFDEENFKVLKLSRIDSNINFDWSTGAPDPSMDENWFSIRWTGQIQPRFTEEYTFYTDTDDGVQLWVNNTLIIDKWDYYGCATSSVIRLEAGKKYDIKMDYHDGYNLAHAKLSWSSLSQPKEIIPSSQLYPPIGLKAEYYSDVNLTNLYASTIDDKIDFDWGAGSPFPNIPTDNFSVRWSGPIQAKSSERYTFRAFTDDGVRVWIDGNLIIDNWNGCDGGEGSIDLAEGKKYDIIMEYCERGGSAAAKLYWKTPNISEEIIPQSQFSPSFNFFNLSEVPVGNGTGLKGEYFDEEDFKVLKLSRIDSNINFDWSTGTPDPNMDANWFSIIWTGQIQPRFTEDYTFYTDADDGVKLWVNNTLIINMWNSYGHTSSSVIKLEAGKKYDIKMEYHDGYNLASAKLSWSSPSQPQEIIPTSQLYPPGGLKAEYYKDGNLTDLYTTTIDDIIQFDWGGGSPFPNIPTDNFSVRWSGQVQAKSSERYTFHASTDDGVRVWIDGNLIINSWDGCGGGSGSIDLAEGKKYDIIMEYRERGGLAAAKLYWSTPNISEEIIPKSQFSPSFNFFKGTFELRPKSSLNLDLSYMIYSLPENNIFCQNYNNLLSMYRQFVLIDAGDGMYFISQFGSKYYLTLNDNNSVSFKTIASDATGKEKQRWRIQPVENGYYKISPKLLLSKYMTCNNNMFSLVECNNSDSQLWKLISGTYDGNDYSRTYTDFDMRMPVLNIPLVRKYNPSTIGGYMGKGWMTGFHGRALSYPPDNNNYRFTVILPDGSIHNFKVINPTFNVGITSYNSVSSDSKSFLKWIIPEDNTNNAKYIVSTQDNYEYTFDCNGELSIIKDPYGNQITITQYANNPGKIDTVNYPNGKRLKYNYGTTPETSELLIGIDDIKNDTVQRSVQYEYDTKKQLLRKFIDANGKSTYYRYDNFGLLCEISDDNGNVVESQEIIKNGDFSGRPLFTTDSFGNTKTYKYYSEAGGDNYTFISDSQGRTVIEKKATNINIQTTYDEEGGITVTEYYSHVDDGISEWDGVKKVTDKFGNVTLYDIDPNNKNNIIRITNPDGSYKRMWYENNHLVQMTDEEGYCTLWQYEGALLKKECRLKDKISQETKMNWPDENASDVAVTTYEYTSAGGINGLVSRIIDPAGYQTDYTYNTDGTLQKVTGYKDSQRQIPLITSYEYDGLGYITSETSPEGYKTSYVYDKKGNVEKVTKYDKSNIEQGTKRITYDSMGRQLKVVSPNAYNPLLDNISSHQYDINNQETGKYTVYTYYPNGKVKSSNDCGDETSYAYDLYGNIKTMTTPEGAIYTYDYDVLNRQVGARFKENSNMSDVLLEKDSFTTDAGHLIKLQTKYLNEYEKATTLFEFDYAQRIKRQINPDDTALYYEYYKNGKVYLIKDAKGSKTIYNYNGFCTDKDTFISKLTQLDDSNNYSFVKFDYDKNGKVIEESYGAAAGPTLDNITIMLKKQYEYYSNSLLFRMSSSIIDPASLQTSHEYDYDKDGNVTSEKIYTGAGSGDYVLTTYENNYLDKPIIKKVSVRKGDIYPNDFEDNNYIDLVSSFAYDKNGNITAETSPNHIMTSYYYDSHNRMSKTTRPVSDENGNSSTAVLEKEYNKDGKVTKLNEYGTITSYGYDKRGNLASITRNGENGPEIERRYYDRAGRMIVQVSANNYDSSKNLEAMNRTVYTYDKMDRLVTEGYKGIVKDYNPSTGQWQDINTGYVQKAYRYDANGNVIKELNASGFAAGPGLMGYGTEYAYDKGNRLIWKRDAISKERGLPFQTKYTYDGLGRVISKIEAKGYDTLFYAKTDYSYDCIGDITKTTCTKSDVNGNAIDTPVVISTNTYDWEGNLLTSKDANGYVTTYEYNKTGKVRKVTNPGDNSISSAVTKYQYDEMGNEAKVTSPFTDTNSKVVTSLYDSFGRVTEECEHELTGSGTGLKGEYFSGQNLTDLKLSRTDSKIDFNWGTGSPDTSIQADNFSVRWTGQVLPKYTEAYKFYTATDDGVRLWVNGQLLIDHWTTQGGTEWNGTINLEVGKKYDIRMEYFEQGGAACAYLRWSSLSQAKEIIPQSQLYTSDSIVTKKFYNVGGDLAKEVDANGTETVHTYDQGKRVIKTSVKLNEGTSTIPQKYLNYVYSYDKNGNVVSKDKQIVSGSSVVHSITRYTYDAIDRLIEVKDPEGNVVQRLEYNYDGQQVASYDADSHATLYEYDKNNRNNRIIDPLGHAASWEYDYAGNVRKKTDAKGHSTYFTYDKYDNLCEVKAQNESGDELTVYTYDANGNMTQMKDGRGNYTGYLYNAINKVKVIIDPYGSAEQYFYYPDGSLKSKMDRNVKTITYAYNVHGDIISQSAPGVNNTYEYDNNGNQTKMVDATGTTTRTYDRLGRVLTKTVPGIGTLSVSYDVITGVPQGEGVYAEVVTDPKGNITTRIYDVCDRVKTVKDGNVSATSKTTYEYNSDGSKKSVTYPGGARESYSYNKDGQLSDLTDLKSGGTFISGSSYTYDENHNITQISGSGMAPQNFVYDWLNRVVSIDSSDGKTITYTYDKAGNRITQTAKVNGTVQQSLSYEYDKRNRLTKITTINYITQSTSTTNNTYDNNGNLVEVKEGSTIKQSNTYDVLNQLTKTVSNGHTIESKYNGEGLRGSKKVDGIETRYLYEGDKVILDTDGGGNQKARNIYGTNLVSRTVNGETLYYMYNLHGDVTALVNAAGDVAGKYDYDIFGNMTSTNGKDNPYAYGGYFFDKETGLYYLGSRMYDPMTARFLQEDTYAGNASDPLTLNLYTYCTNNPLSYLDPDGHSFISFFEDIGRFFVQQENQIASIVASTSMIVAGAALTAVTFGGSSIISAGLIGAGISGLMYTATNFNDFQWDQWGINTGVGAVTGLLTAGIGSGVSSFGIQGAKAVAVDTVAGSGIGALDSYVSNGIATGEWSGEGAAMASGLGALSGVLGSVAGTEASKVLSRINALKGCTKLAKSSRIAASIVAGAGTGAGTGYASNGIMTGEWSGEEAARAAYLSAASGAIGGAISGISESFGMCFVAGTLVSAKEGLKAIESISVGDEVYAENVETGEKGLKKVTEVFESDANVLVDVKTDTEDITTTVFHPFCVERDGTKSFIEAQYLKAGDKIITKSGKKIVVKSVIINYLDHVVKVYNFEVADWHDYYVGKGSLLVHNPPKGCGKKSARAGKKRESAEEVFVRFGSEAEALKSIKAKGLVRKQQNGNETRGSKWISEEARPRDVKSLGKSKNYTHKITIKTKRGTKEWFESKKIDFENMKGGESNYKGNVIFKSNEQGSFGIGADLINEFNQKWVTEIKCDKIK